MAMSLTQVGEAMGRHPYITGGSIVVGGLGILWLFGFFDKAPSGGADAGTQNMAAAYYAAEAAQAAAGAEIQSISLQTTAKTAQTKISADAAVAINDANTGAATIINAQNTGSANTINQQNTGRDIAVTGLTTSGQIQQTQINANAATSQNESNNATAVRTATIGADASTLNTAFRTVLPQELALNGQGAAVSLPQGLVGVSSGGPASIDFLVGQGFTRAEAARLAGVG